MKQPALSLALLFLAHSVTCVSAEPTTLDTATSDNIFCERIWNGQVEDDNTLSPGRICFEIATANRLVVSYQLDDDWQLEESFVWFGNSAENVPQIHGHVDLDDFPYIAKNIGGKSSFNVTLPLNNGIIAPSCTPENDTKLHLVLHPVILRNSINEEKNDQQPTKEMTESKSSFLRASNKPDKVHGLWWMEVDLALSCQQDSSDITEISNMQLSKHRHSWATPRRRLDETDGCMPLPSNVDSSDLLTDEFLTRFNVATKLAADVAYDRNLVQKQDYYRTMYERFDGFADGLNDAAVVAKVNDVCYGVFRGTVEFNYWDNLQNFLPGYEKVPGTDCYVRQGFYNGYFTNYQLEFEDSIRGCVNSCEAENGEKCELILSGGSQGASIAIVASMYLKEEFDPTVISIGAMRTFLPTSPFHSDEKCTHINEKKLFHFVLTDEVLKVYDGVPYVFAMWAKNAGHEILYDGNGNFNYQGLAGVYNLARKPNTLAIHTRWNYVVKSKRAYDQACLPAPASGWRDNHWCTEDDNCMSSSYCSLGLCVPKIETGAFAKCERDVACVSGFCNTKNGMCEDQIGADDIEITKRDGSLEDGEGCFSDDDCASGNCEGIMGFWKKCAPP